MTKFKWPSFRRGRKPRKRPTTPLVILYSIILSSLSFTYAAKVPTFNPAEATVSFSEEAVIGTRRLLEPATIDPPGQIVSYEILDDPNSLFRIHETRSQNGNEISYLHLETREKLDREKTSDFKLKISATSANGDKGYLTLNVEVLDINDNPPVFEDNEYRVSINDSLEIGSQIVQTVATDADDGKNGKISYHMPDEFATHFDLDEETGWIKTRSMLKCKDKNVDTCLPCLKDSRVCSILVVATDGGQPQQSAQTVVKINLLDTNDHPPEISFRYLPDQSRPYAGVEVGAETGSSVAAVTVTDQDQGKHGQTSVEIIGGNNRKFFRLESYGGSLSVIRVSPGAKFSPGERYNLTLKASDLGSPPKVSIGSLAIVVNEGNEHAPLFDSEEYNAVLSEDLPTGSSVVAVRATDKDEVSGLRTGRHLLYNITEGNDLEWFQIHSLSGLITTKSNLDREIQESFSLTVSVTDGGIRPKFSTAKVVVKLTDVNDLSPVFEKSVYEVSVSENVTPNETFFTVTARDADAGDNGIVTYSIENFSNLFHIDSMSGELSTLSNLDRENIDNYVLIVTATDKGQPSKSSSAEVRIQVSDENDNSPFFYPLLYFVPLPSVVRRNGPALVTLTGLDEDLGLNSKLKYKLETSDGSEQSARLDEDSGELFLERSISGDKVLKISATDGGGRKTREDAEVRLFSNKTDGIFSTSEFVFKTIEDDGRSVESTILHRQIGYVTLESETLRGTFDIVDGDPFDIFEIDRDTGLISTQKSVDRERQAEYRLKVVVAILGTKSFSECLVRIEIDDINDVIPSFTSNDANIVFADGDAAIGQPLHRVEVEDGDLGENGRIGFTLEDKSGYFAIDPNQGTIIVRKGLSDAKIGDDFRLKVTISDRGDPALSSSKMYSVRLNRVNVHTPIFDFDNNEITISENTPLNTEIITLAAIDQDEGLNGDVLYSIADGEKQKFGIFPDGKVYLKEYLDRETKAYYAITVLAYDKGIPERSSTATVVVYVADENDNSPILVSENDVVHVDENSSPETVVGRVSASDADVGRNAELTYTFSNGMTSDNFLRIDSRTGFISSVSTVDREALIRERGQDSFQLDVVISDNGVFRRTTPVAVNVIVVDKNDNAPEFSEDFYDTSVSESAKVGADILTVHAKDIDKDRNGDVVYSFKNTTTDEHPFKIDPTSGLVSLNGKLDRETIDRYVLTVVATDGGTPTPLVGEAQLKIRVLDENDETPTFATSKLVLPLSEGTKIGAAVHQFQAVDRDLGYNGRVKYFLGGGDHRNLFHLDSNTGFFTLTGPLDRETRDTIQLTVTAVDGGSPQLTGTVDVTINVEDINDNAPTFPTSAILANVKENLPIGTKIRRISAQDSDLADNGRIEYSLKGTEDFRIDPDSGDLFTNVKLDREVTDSYIVIVVATDKGKPRLSTEKVITVVVEDENDNSPEVISLNSVLLLPGTPKGTTLMTIRAIDEDASSNGIVTFRFAGEGSPSSRGLLSLDQHTGQIILSRDIEVPENDIIRIPIVASDDAVPSVRRSATATVVVVPGREKPGPSFTTDLYRSTVKENSPAGTLVGTVSLGVTDENARFYLVGCESERGRERGLFSVDQSTGQIRTIRKIDREIEGNKITLQIVALTGDDTMSGCKMEVTCLDENDTPPVFDESLKILLSEAFLPGQRLAKVKATDKDLDSVINYSLSLATQSFMEIQAQTGELTLTQSIDREEYNSIEVLIYASDGVQTTEWKKKIEVQDVNDNAPMFETPTFSFDILENAERGAIVGRVEATDLDRGSAASRISYTFISDWGIDTFSLDPTSGVITLSGNSLDHEDIEHYILIVSASDAGEPALTATTTIYVNVKDVNDNPPDIEKSLYEINVAENVDIGTSILHVRVTDKDSDENTVLAFNLDSSVSDVFEISSNGTITTKKSLDRESIPFFAFQVTVTDHADSFHQLTSACVVQITVDDVNDERPQFEPLPTLSVFENSPANTPISTIRAFDRDSGKNAELEYLLEDSQMGKFSIGRIDGVLRCVESLDREKKSEYSLTITAVDGGNPRLSSRVDVTVQVLDVNDNTPEFSQKFYSTSVFENASIGMDLLHASAVDRDVAENGRLRYTILSGDNRGDFAIGETSGILRVNKQLDYERRNSYELTLQVEDGGDPGRYDTSSVTVLVLDSNDNAPVFEHSPYTIKILENVDLSRAPFFTVRARDRDDAPFNDVEYSIRAGGQHDNYFVVNSTTGDVYISGPVDREEISELTLELLALDSGTPRLTGTGTLHVIIEDINDHEPRFENDEYFLTTEENVDIGTTLDAVHAFDQDVGLNAKLRYSLEGTEFFEIDETSGMISTRKELDRETLDRHVFRVLAQDSSEFQPLTGTATVTVRISDVDDNRPNFETSGSNDFFIPTGVREGNFILGVSASDADENENAKLKFSLSGKDSKLFDINRNNGVVTASQLFKEKISYDVTVDVQDEGLPHLKNRARFSVYLAEELVVPRFDDSATPPQVNVNEDLALGETVVNVRSVPDSLNDEEVGYGIAGGNLGNVFDVDSNSGRVFVNQSLDFETTTHFELWVKTFYKTKPLFFAAKKVVIEVKDKNDNAPVFENQLVKVSVSEGIFPPFDIAEVFAIDADAGENGEVTYELISYEPDVEKGQLFKVDPDTGLIRCHKELDRETLDRYTIKVGAYDKGTPRQSSTATVLLTVEDVNDNAPRFARLYTLNITENVAVGTDLLYVATVDKDGPENSKVTYDFVENPDGAFTIHPVSGKISVAKSLDREIRDEYSLRVRADDGSWKLETVITVTLVDDNDNAPLFDRDLYEFAVPHVKNNVSTVGKVHALDRDAPGPNSAVSYSLAYLHDFFNVDETSGVIVTKKDLSFHGASADNTYRIRIVATDAGSPPMSSECEVSVTVVGGNENAPKFDEDEANAERRVAIPAGLGPDTLVYSLSATDADSQKLRFAFSSENISDYFRIDSETGKIFTSQSLIDLQPASTLVLEVTVYDGGIPNRTDTTQVAFLLTADNLHAPEFQSPATRIYIREDEQIGNTIVTLKASDADEGINGQVEYAIVTGDPENKFEIDKTSGNIVVKEKLDYEKIPVYNLVIRGRDLGFYSKSATSGVKIILQDVDDNPPIFDKSEYEANLKENSEPGAEVTQMIATDLDSPKNGKIEYELINHRDEFSVDPVTGIVTSKVVFDYEQTDSVELKIRAKNPSDASVFAETVLKVSIEGENEFFPKFRQPVFQFVVSESAQIGDVVGQVEAPDVDKGKDGEVFYYIVGFGSGFGVDRTTGIIRVRDPLDRESQNRYVLTVLAKNGGSIRGNDTDEAQVIIQVQDGNDPPVFRKPLYTAKISEAAAIGASVVTVSAVDKDVRPRNSQFSYSIYEGNTDNKFTIDPGNGVITVEKSLDREDVDFYNLTIRAVDNGAPPAIGETRVHITVDDVNDSPPVLPDVKAYVKENNPPGSIVKQFDPTDPDPDPNGGPFTFTLLPGKNSELFALDSTTGVLKTSVSLDREQTPTLEISIRISDSGSPSLSADFDILVEVGDENDNPSLARSVDVVIKNYEGTFPGGEILFVRPADQDLVGDYQCELLEGPEAIFNVDRDCVVRAGRIQNGREYDLKIRTNDGKHDDVEVKARLNFVAFSEFAVRESVSVRFGRSTASDVLGFFEKLRSSYENRLLELLSLNANGETVECFLASRENSVFLPKSDTLSYLREISTDLDSAFKDAKIVYDYDPCSAEKPCLNGGKCSSRVVVMKKTEIAESGNTVFNSPSFVQNVSCHCPNEFGGERCDRQKNPCLPNPCLEGGQCLQEGDTFHCLCPSLRGGKTCELQKTNACHPNPCLNGGSCQNSKTNGFFCLCRPGYQGDACQDVIDTCRQNPCLNGGTCVSLKPNYRCRCHDHYYGNHCEFSTFGFDELSYTAFHPLDPNTNDISITFATSKPNSLLVYNYGKSAGGRSDFLAVELVAGRPRLSWGGGRTAITSLVLPKQVDTGRWYKVTATRNNRVGSLSVEDCTESGEFCKTCQPDDERCFTKEIGEAGTLVFNDNYMYFGGIPDETAILDRPGQLSTVDFVGCIKSISINGNEKNLLKESLNRTGLTNTCNRAEGGACSRGDECGPTGTCIPLWSHHKCKCGHDEILAPDCGESFDPITLTENQEVHFKPSKKYRQTVRLGRVSNLLNRWRRDATSKEPQSSMSISFRTLKKDGPLLSAESRGGTHTRLEISEGILMYKSLAGLAGKSEINMTTDLDVADGSWHTVRLEVMSNILRFYLDGQRVGYEVEFSAAHNFLDPDLEKVVIGNAKQHVEGFRGCIANFTLNDELQSARGRSGQLLEADLPAGVHLNGCDVDVLRVVQSKSAVDVGVTVVIVFFVLLLCAIAASFTFFKLRRKMEKKASLEAMQKEPQQQSSSQGGGGGHVNRSMELESGSFRMNNQQQPTPKQRPDIIEAESGMGRRGVGVGAPLPRLSPDPMFVGGHEAEHYDLENASSIAPSDIDIVYHYKGYRRGGRSLPKKKRHGGLMQNTPLARLSPSSEISHNTPRILTLGDLSGKRLPPGLLAEQSERSLNSPVSHVSSGSRHSRHHNNRGGLTSENVARFNSGNGTGVRYANGNNTSTLVNTLDLVSVGSESRKKSLNNYDEKSNNNINVKGDLDLHSSSSSDTGDDSFTCSEFECDSNNGAGGVKDMSDASGGGPVSGGGMVFNKLSAVNTSRTQNRRPRSRFAESDEEIDDDDDLRVMRSRPDSAVSGGRSWEHLLTWWPDYDSFAGVFKDISALPNSTLASELEQCRPSPLGDRQAEEEYI